MKNLSSCRRFFVVAWMSWCAASVAVGAEKYASHPPMRTLPVASQRPMTDGPAKFVALTGNDADAGTKEKPWRTLTRAVQSLEPGETLYVRGGTYHESVTVALRTTPEQPITIRSYPGEVAIIDAGHREFLENPAEAWEPVADGAEGEYRSTKSYCCGGGFGNFADSMVPLHRYLNLYDLRSANEFFSQDVAKRNESKTGIYCGPGTFRDPATGRIHIRLAHHKLPGLGDRAYRGETDPRKLPLIIAAQDVALRLEGAQNVKIQDLVVRGGERTAIDIAEDSEDFTQDSLNVVLDGLTVYGSNAAIQTRRVDQLKIVNCALRGHSAPWHSRAHHKYRAHAGYLVYPRGKRIEIANSELTDNHDCITMTMLDEMQFHHNLVDNFDDDGLESGPKRERGKIYLYQNIITRTLSPFTLHGDKPIPVETAAGHGVYIFRNLVDLRSGVYRAIPQSADVKEDYLNSPTITLAHDHGGPVHPNYFVYHNTFLLPNGLFRDLYLYGWSHGTRMTTRRVFNNVFVQVDGLATMRVIGLNADEDFQADGNLIWSVNQGASFTGDYFAKFRATPLFEASKKQYADGWSAHDVFGDPQFVKLDPDTRKPSDVRLQASSPAKDAGVKVPAEWPDPLRAADAGAPDLGALPLGAAMLQVGPQAPGK